MLFGCQRFCNRVYIDSLRVCFIVHQTKKGGEKRNICSNTTCCYLLLQTLKSTDECIVSSLVSLVTATAKVIHLFVIFCCGEG